MASEAGSGSRTDTARKPGLAALQGTFVEAIATWNGATPPGITSHSGVTTVRMNAYRRNVQASLIGTLENRFPVVARLTGLEFFRAMAALHLAAAPPRSPVLLDYGRDFPAFIAGFEPAADVPYLADVAQLEWLQHEAYHSAEAQPLSPEMLSAIEPADLPGTTFALHPSVRLLVSRYPVLDIWHTNANDTEVKPIDLAKGSCEILVVRPEDRVVIHRLPAGGDALLKALGAGAPLASAADAAMTAAAHADVQRILASVITSQCLIGYSPAAQ